MQRKITISRSTMPSYEINFYKEIMGEKEVNECTK